MRRLPGGVDLPDFFRNKSTRTQFSICCYMRVLGQSPKLWIESAATATCTGPDLPLMPARVLLAEV